MSAQMPQAIMLFAAGFGTRMLPLTQNTPKPLIQVAGKALLDHALELTDGLSKRVVNAHYHGDQITRHLAGQDIAVVQEQPEVLDTGGGLKNALPLLGRAPVYTLNTDAIWHGPNPLPLLAQAWRPDEMDALLLCVPTARAVGRKGDGDFSFDPENRLLRGGDMVYTGAQILKTDLLSDVKETVFSLNKIWNLMAEQGRLYGTSYPGTWCDVGYPEAIALAEAVADV